MLDLLDLRLLASLYQTFGPQLTLAVAELKAVQYAAYRQHFSHVLASGGAFYLVISLTRQVWLWGEDRQFHLVDVGQRTAVACGYQPMTGNFYLLFEDQTLYVLDRKTLTLEHVASGIWYIRYIEGMAYFNNSELGAERLKRFQPSNSEVLTVCTDPNCYFSMSVYRDGRLQLTAFGVTNFYDTPATPVLVTDGTIELLADGSVTYRRRNQLLT